MQPIPVKVKNVNIYPYINFNSGGPGPVIPPVITNAQGTYAVGTLGLSVFYNLNISDGVSVGKLSVHNSYIAEGEYENGSPFTSHWMYCLDNTGPSFEFGLTTTLLSTTGTAAAANVSLNVPPYIVLAPLTNINVSQLFPPPAIGQLSLITNGTGNIIATKFGTPHEMGVEVQGGIRSGSLHNGMTRIVVSGKTKEGHTVAFSGLTCLDARDPSIFLRVFGE